jgi:hypothetical protein
MTSNNWGGRREGAGSGGRREGAGRPRAKWNSGGPGSAWVMERQTIGGDIHAPQLWRVLAVGMDEIEFQCGDDIIVLRRPDDAS